MKYLNYFTIAAPLVAGAGTKVDYSAANHDKAWGAAFCNGNQNSPIDLTGATPNHYNQDPINAYAIVNCINSKLNSGNYQLTINYDTESGWENQQALKFTFSPEPLCNGYKVAQYHYHFDKSEHTIAEDYSYGEVHYVTYKNEFADLGAAVAGNSTGNLAVFGFMLDVNENAKATNADTAAFQANLDAYKNAADASSLTAAYKAVVPAAFQNPNSVYPNNFGNMNGYFRYEGGLTTPACNEVVTWTVFNDKIDMTAAQRTFMQENFKEGYLRGNNRKVQDLAGRTLTHFENTHASMTKEFVYVSDIAYSEDATATADAQASVRSAAQGAVTAQLEKATAEGKLDQNAYAVSVKILKTYQAEAMKAARRRRDAEGEHVFGFRYAATIFYNSKVYNADQVENVFDAVAKADTRTTASAGRNLVAMIALVLPFLF